MCIGMANGGKQVADGGKKVFTDKEIIQALECCITDNKKCNCEDCPYKEKVIGFCFDELNKDAIDLINRQQAEIERLKKGWKADVIETENIRAEAIKEFAEQNRS